MLPSQIVEFIQTFYGYGNLDGKYWLIGMEEGGGGSLNEVVRRLQVWRDLGCPVTADVAEYHLRLGMPKFFREPVTLQRTWSHLIRLVLSAKGEPSEVAQIKAYQKDKLGRAGGETCLLELLPLPSPGTGTWNYGAWTGLPYLRNREVYRQTILPRRIEHLRQLIGDHRPPVVVFYGATYRSWFEQIAGSSFADLPIDGAWGTGRGETCFVLVKHPVAFGVTKKYFREIGQEIGGLSMIL